MLLTGALAIAGVYFVIDMMSSNDYFLQRIKATKEGDSSGRDSIYSFFWTYFTERADFVHYLFGRGANGTLEIYYNYAHNDWLRLRSTKAYWVSSFMQSIGKSSILHGGSQRISKQRQPLP